MKTYLGDDVYAEKENGMIKLCVGSGVSTKEKIFIEQEVYEVLKIFARREMGWEK